MNINFSGPRITTTQEEDPMAASAYSGSHYSSGGSVGSSLPVVRNWNSKRTLPDLLATRQLYGRGSRPASLPTRRAGRVNTAVLAHRAAWNPYRLQNMILAVGPGTPAAVVMNSTGWASHSSRSSASSSASSSSASSSVAADDIEEDSTSSVRANAPSTQISEERGQTRRKMEDEDREDDDEEEDDEDIENTADPDEEREKKGRSRWTVRHRRDGGDGEDEAEEDDDDDDDDDDEEDGNNRINARDIIESALMDWYGGESSGDDESSADGIDSERHHVKPSKPVPSMRHGGCINTAAWLDCGWRLSTSSIGGGSLSSPCTGIETEECPTQLVTSGDDHLVKFWDVSHAMGTDSPLPGGSATICPFSAPRYHSQDATRKTWTEYYKKSNASGIAGTVLPLATLHTGHRGNVFHVTPVKGSPGQVATCGADGFLRLTDLETGDAKVVVSPEYEDDIGGLFPAGLLSLRPGMCFSHHFLNQHTGLLCSERGLRRFDLRLPPREQPTRSLFGGPFRACKACAVWSSQESPLEGGDSAYVFAGGSSADVALGDLRMADGSSSKIIQRYRPSGLMMSDHVSVSGLDLSRDKQELLISYESDQIYTFPVFPGVKSPAGPSVDEIQNLSKSEGNGKVLSELAAYGGHLNRFTFLKNAKYAGPRDEYICTGSDSGHAWIYEKSTGAVVSFLNADHSTCNGVIPHPTLPVFVTYGIDSTAKLWRACTPVDSDVDDSPEGRYKCYQKTEYEMSPCVRKWDEVHQALRIFSSETCDEIDIPPDAIPDTKILTQRGRFGRHFLSRDGSGGGRLGNDLHNLPQILKQNLYSCIRSLVDGDDVPVESDIEALKHRVSIIRLRHQADRLGLRFNPSRPWQLERRSSIKDGDVHAADLVPDPSDWIPYDPETSKSPWDFANYFNHSEYGDFYRDRYLLQDGENPMSNDDESSENEHIDEEAACEEGKGVKRGKCGRVKNSMPLDQKVVSSSSEEDCDMDNLTAMEVLYDTMLVLKDGGNVAMHSGKLDLAASRYDKAIQYGAVATMSFPVKNLEFAKDRIETLKDSGWHGLEWTPILKLLIITRLNLALLMLKPYFSHPDQTVEQARLALEELEPFCAKKGKVVLDGVRRDDEPAETFVDAKALEAKAYFRLGSAQFELGDSEEAINSFEQSVKSTQDASSKPDALVLRRLNEAKKESRRRNKKRKKKFKFAFAGKEN